MDNEIMQIKLDDIIPNRFQPREVFNEEDLNKLADSIRQHGVIEPILVRPVSNKYEIVAGERRYKASVLAGLTKIPAIVRKMDDKESSIVAFIENEHRSDVSAIEEARTMNRILSNNNMTQDELAKELGVNQSTVANKLRLLNLPMEIQDALMHNEISERHARSLLSVKEESKQIELLNKIKENKMTVRELDSEIKNMNNNFNVDNSVMNNGQMPGIMPQEGNNDFMNFLNNYDNNYQTTNNATPEEPVQQAPQGGNNNFMNFLNDFDKNYQATPNETPEEPVQQAPQGENNDFMSFLNDFDKNYQADSNETPVEPAQAAPQEGNNDFMNFLNDFDKNYQADSNETPVEPVQQAPQETNDDFMKFLNDYDANYQKETPAVEPTSMENNTLNNNYMQYNDASSNILLNNVTPPITSGNSNQYIEQSDNYVDITKQEKIASVDEIIDKLSNVVNEIKEKSIYKVDTEEINYDDIYQITIKIDKRDF